METVRTFETLAVETFERKTREKEEADRLRREQNQRRLDDYQANFKDVYLPDTLTAFAQYFGLAPDDQLVRDLEWSTDQAEWTHEVQQGFTTGRALAPNKWPHLYVTVAGVRLQPEDQELAQLLTGARNQQLSRNLAFGTVESRERRVKRSQEPTNEYLW